MTKKRKRETIEVPRQPELITPTLAAHWLEKVPVFQRKRLDRQIKKIATAISKNEWKMNGATIVFNERDELIDGQHRLAAIIMAGKSVYSLVIRGVPSDPQTFHTIGDEAPRRLADFLRSSTTNVHNVASVLAMIWQMKEGHWPFGRGHARTPPIADVLKVGEKWTSNIAALVEPTAAAGRVVHQASYVVFLSFYYGQLEPVPDMDRLINFFLRLGDGVGLAADDPVYRLRQKYLALRPGELIDRSTGQALILKALHLYLDGEPCGKLQFRIESENYPELRKAADWEKPKKERAKLDETRATERTEKKEAAAHA